MSIVWVNIQNVQSGSKAKSLINQCFNVGNYIATIRGANMNPGVPQYQNCWRWGHTTLSCRIQGARYIKCSNLHKTEHHHQFGWCYKANDKVNPPNLKQRKANYAYMHSNAQTIVVITKWTLTSVYSENIDSIANGTAKNKPKSVKADIS